MKFFNLAAILIVMPCLGTGHVCSGQEHAMGARSGGLAGISVSIADAWAWANNPAAMASLDELTLGTCSEQRFLLKGTGVYAAGIVVPTGAGCLGLGTVVCGYHSFYRQDVRIGYGKSFAGRFKAGVGLVYRLQKSGNESPSTHLASFSLGTVISITKKLSAGILAFNPFKIYFRSQPYGTLPAFLAFGLEYRHSSSLALHAEMEKDFDLPPQLRLGCEIIFAEHAFVRGGISLMPFEYAIGAGFRKKRLLLEIASLYHEYLGITPVLSIQFEAR